MRGWIGLGLLFAILIVSRMFAVEEALRDHMRLVAKAQDAYTQRRDWQAIFIAFAASVSVLAAFFAAFRASQLVSSRKDFCVVAAVIAGGAMIALIGLRLISLHAVDTYLYGPAKLNWIGDIASSAAVLGFALYYTAVSRRRGLQ